MPTFCEKPVAATLDETLDLAELVVADRRPRPRRLPAPLRPRLPARRSRPSPPASSASCTASAPARTTRRRRTPPTSRPAAGSSATARSTTSTSSASSPAARSPRSTRPAPTRAPRFFTEAGDVDTAAAVLTLDDGTLVSLSATRYNGAGHDVRMEVLGSEGTIGVGYDDSLAVTSAEPGADLPVGPATLVVHGALPAGLPRRADGLRRRRPRRAAPRRARSTTPSQAFRVAEACELSRREGRPVALDEIPGL